MVNCFFAVLVTHVSIQREVHPSVGHNRRWPDYLNWQAKLAKGLWGALHGGISVALSMLPAAA